MGPQFSATGDGPNGCSSVVQLTGVYGGVERLGIVGAVRAWWPECVLTVHMWSQEHERRAAEMRQRKDRERLASRLGHEHLRIAEMVSTNCALERHYSVQEIGELWQLSSTTVTRLFRDEPGVLKIGRDRPSRGRRNYMTLRVPESVVERVHRRLTVR